MSFLHESNKRCQALSLIPQKKIVGAQERVIKNCEICKNKTPEQILCKACNYKTIAIKRYAESNIPVEYWFLDMETHFKGFATLKKKYDEYTSDIKKTYLDGLAVCFAGSYGVGKSLTSACILKVACLKGYT